MQKEYMKRNILKEVLEFEENKGDFTDAEQIKIRGSLLKEIEKNLKKAGRVFLKSIDDINKL